ncbi:MAG: glycosyltransferase family 2 protein [Candidatus Aegiribacteria sp.]|nr:glycosyltransferase family 2 protein [Candidatus Aegiribacteria sp.]
MKQIAIIIPCLNEELTVARVISDFQRILPDADIYVIDNNSTDSTASIALENGATVITEKQQGKGIAVRKAFRKIEADIYILIDGDDTYPVEDVNSLLAPIFDDTADIVVGSRLSSKSNSSFRLRNKLGNMFFRLSINVFFKASLTDILSGYRVMTRDFVKRMPILARGFEIETELTIMALNRGFRIVEVPVDLQPRPFNSISKIHVLSDGFRILREIISLFCYYKPLSFFGSLGFVTLIASLLTWILPEAEVSSSAFAPILSIGLALAGLLSISVGGILHVTTRRFQELDHRLDLLNDEVTTAN